MTPLDQSQATLAARAYHDGRRTHRPMSLPLVRATTYQVASAAAHGELYASGSPEFYLRFGNPTTAAAAAKLALLEGAEEALLFGSGMGAIATGLLASLRAGDHVVRHVEVFAQTVTIIDEVLPAFGVTSTVVDARDPAAVEAAMTPRTRVVYIETPSNPLLHVVPIAAVAEVARRGGAELFVDGTFASPCLQRPLEHGATLVLHSATKYLGGHSDVMAGAAAGGTDIIARVRRMQYLLGTVLDPEAAWLLVRGMKTLPLRVERQSATALAVARFLSERPEVSRVRYPGLESDEGHAVAARQMSAGGGMVSFELAGGRDRARRFADALRGIPIATSLGGTETMIELPYDLDFVDGPAGGGADERPLGLLRLSVGLEAPEDIIADLRQGLEA